MPPEIESYRFGHIIIDGKSHDQDVIILPDRVIGGWWRKEGHALHPEDLDQIIRCQPALLIVGKGANGRMRVTDGARQALQRAGIDIVALPTEEAVERYNARRDDEEDVAAALHLTC